jgi:hypothetical protein
VTVKAFVAFCGISSDDVFPPPFVSIAYTDPTISCTLSVLVGRRVGPGVPIDVHRKNPGTGCAFSTLAPELARSDKRTRALTSEQVRDDLELIVGLLPGKNKRAARSRAILTFSALVGAMSLARAVSEDALSREILKTVADLLKHPA